MPVRGGSQWSLSQGPWGGSVGAGYGLRSVFLPQRNYSVPGDSLAVFRTSSGKWPAPSRTVLETSKVPYIKINK